MHQRRGRLWGIRKGEFLSWSGCSANQEGCKSDQGAARRNEIFTREFLFFKVAISNLIL